MRRFEKVKRLISFLTVLTLTFGLVCFPAFAKPVWPSDTGIMAEAGIVVDADSGAVLFGQNIHVAYPPASITKLLTALVVAENASLDDMVTFSHDAVYNVESGSGNATGLEEGDILSVRDCLHILLLRSSNQAANALAEHVAGSCGGFVDMMNARIAELGCKESHFANPSGLNDDKQYVSAYDMALIAQAAFENDIVLEIGSTRTYKMPATINNPDGVTIAMEHRLLMAEDRSSQYYLEGAVAGKTGYTSLAGNTLVTYAVRDGRGVISVILKGTQPQYYYDGKTLIEFGFASFQNIPVAANEKFLNEQEQVEIKGVSYAAIDLYLDPDAVVTVPNGGAFSNVERSLVTDLSAESPDNAVAKLEYTYDERKVGEAYLYTSRQVTDENQPVVSMTDEISAEESRADEKISSSVHWEVPDGFTKAVGIIVVLALIVLVVFLLWYRQKKECAAAARRRAMRRQRLRELGYKEEEFNRMVNERRQNRNRSRKRR